MLSNVIGRARKWTRNTAAEIRDALRPGAAWPALRTGSGILLRVAWSRIAPQDSLFARLGYVGLGLYVVGFVATNMPSPAAVFIASGVALGWCVAAWTIAPPVGPEPEQVPAAEPTQAFQVWLLQLIGDRPGIHLRELYPAMRRLPGHEHLNDAQLRAALRTLGIPVSRSVRIGVLAGRSGVYRTALTPLPSPRGEPRVEQSGDAGQSAVSPAGEPLESGVEQPGEPTS